MDDRILGYSLHPIVRQQLEKAASPRIADIGTGTGAFLLALGTEFPSATLDGFDISDTQFPGGRELPANISFHVADMKRPFPQELLGTYDVVHIRLVVAAMNPDEWRPTYQNILTLLKPGGAVQWEECNFNETKYVRAASLPTEPYVASAGQRLTELFLGGMQTRGSHGWNELPQIAASDSFTSATYTDVTSNNRLPEVGDALSRNGLSATLGYVRRARRLPEEEIDELERKAHAEVDAGWRIRYDIHVMIAFKAV